MKTDTRSASKQVVGRLKRKYHNLTVRIEKASPTQRNYAKLVERQAELAGRLAGLGVYVGCCHNSF